MSKNFLSYLSSSISGSVTGALVQVIPCHSLQVEAQFKLTILEEQLFLHGLLQLQCITLSRSGGRASISVIIGVYIFFSVTHPHLRRSFSISLNVFKFEPNDKLEAHDKMLPYEMVEKGLDQLLNDQLQP